jgi:hypothetical protein
VNRAFCYFSIKWAKAVAGAWDQGFGSPSRSNGNTLYVSRAQNPVGSGNQNFTQ